MTNDELIQKVMIVEPSTMVAYMMALRSDNPTIESVMHSLFNAINPRHCGEAAIWKGFHEAEAWNLLNYIHINDTPMVLAALDDLNMVSRLCYGEQIAAFTEKLVTHVGQRWHGNRSRFEQELASSDRTCLVLIDLYRRHCWELTGFS